MRNLRLTIAYDGTGYSGWQFQPNGMSIQQALESAWQTITGEQLRITASGRTDAGVHARGQVCSLRTASEIDCESLVRAINANVPRDIVVEQISEAPEGFHAIRDAVNKCYEYRIVAGRLRDVMDSRTAWHVGELLDISAMQDAARCLVGKHDFASFQATGSNRLSSVREIRRLAVSDVTRNSRQYITIGISADGFLYNMVRIIAGSLVQVGRGTRNSQWLEESLGALDRMTSGPTAPALGLCLVSVCYPEMCVCGAGECPAGKGLCEVGEPEPTEDPIQ